MKPDPIALAALAASGALPAEQAGEILAAVLAPPAPLAYFYLQDSRDFVGNDLVFWRTGGGYTTDVSKAEKFNQHSAFAQHRMRPTDIPWPIEYIDSRTRPAVDCQYVAIGLALQGTGFQLEVGSRYKPEKKYRPARMKCNDCGKFIAEGDQFRDCPHCGSNGNRP